MGIDLEEVKKDHERFMDDVDWVQEHRQELLRHYSECWIAVYHQQVVASAKDIEPLVQQLECEGIRPGRAYHEYLTRESFTFIVTAQSQ